MRIVGNKVETSQVEVNISGYDLSQKLRLKLIRLVAPASVASYDYWYISPEGYVIGVTDSCGRGTDIEIKLELAGEGLTQQLKAIHTTLSLLKQCA